MQLSNNNQHIDIIFLVLLGIVWKGIARRGEDKASYLSKKGDSQCKTENYTDSY
jgi:hypothetical protein